MNFQDELEKVAGEYVNAFGMQNEKGKQVYKENQELARETGAPRHFRQGKAVREMDAGYDTTGGDMLKKNLKDSYSPRNFLHDNVLLPGAGIAAGAGAGALVGTMGNVGKATGRGAMLGGVIGGTAGLMSMSNRQTDNAMRDLEDRNNAMREYAGRNKEASSLEDELEKIALSLAPVKEGAKKVKDKLFNPDIKRMEGDVIMHEGADKLVGPKLRPEPSKQTVEAKDKLKAAKKDQNQARGIAAGAAGAGAAAFGAGAGANALSNRKKEASSIEEELEKIAGMMGNLTGSTVRGMKKNIAGVEAAGADASLLKKQLPAAQKSRNLTQAGTGAGLLAAGAGATAIAKSGDKEKTASTFGEEAEKEKKDRPSTDKPSEKDKDNKKDAENRIKDEKEKAEGRTWSDADKEGFVAKEAQSVDFMNELFKEAAANLSSEVMEKVASHTDALSRITASTFGYEPRTR